MAGTESIPELGRPLPAEPERPLSRNAAVTAQSSLPGESGESVPTSVISIIRFLAITTSKSGALVTSRHQSVSGTGRPSKLGPSTVSFSQSNRSRQKTSIVGHISSGCSRVPKYRWISPGSSSLSYAIGVPHVAQKER